MEVGVPLHEALGRGFYGAAESLQLLNYRRPATDAPSARLGRQTLSRWLRGYDFKVNGEVHRSEPLWRPDYPVDERVELSFRDLIELRFVKAFRDAGLSLQTIRICFQRAVEEVRDPRPFSTRRFRTDGKTIFLEITEGVEDGRHGRSPGTSRRFQDHHRSQPSRP